MDLTRGSKVTARNGVVSWDSRMKIDETKTNSQQNADNTGTNKVRAKQGLIGTNGKRKTWKSESSEKNPIQISRQKSEVKKNLGEECKQISVSVDEVKKSPIQKQRNRSISHSDGIERNSIPLRKSKSESNKAVDESSHGSERNGELRKVKSESIKAVDESSHGSERNGELRKVKLESNKAEFDLIEAIEKNPDEIVDENVEGFDYCEEKVITSNLGNVGQLKSPSKMEGSGQFDEELKEEIGEEIEIEIEKQSAEEKVEEIEIEIKKQSVEEKVVIEEKKIDPNNGKPLPISPIVRKQIPPVVNHPKIVPKPTKSKPIPVSDEFKRGTNTNNKLQSLVDLMMWRDVSKSTFIFGLGTFTIVSSSYTKDLNISFISVVSYLGLVYLAAIFFFRSIIWRGAIDIDDASEDYVVGEEEAVWLLKLILPYINEFLLKIRSLFSGNPSTTMKLAVLLFVLARCGSSITIWKMAKLGFFGVFTVPKVCSSYSPQLTAYGTFWIRRFRDAWESCSHKKAVSFGIFTLVWNLSSVVARIWAVFMLIVAFRYYQHSMMRDEEWVEEGEEEEEEVSCERKVSGQRQRRGGPTTSAEIKRKKKG